MGNDASAVVSNVFNTIFQSTFPRGERPDAKLKSYSTTTISIHVPAWGTTASRVYTRVEDNFNPRSRVGNDGRLRDVIASIMQFQSTFPRGERRDTTKAYTKAQKISIHVPAWGTTEVCSYYRRKRGFQSTFPRGERRWQTGN